MILKGIFSPFFSPDQKYLSGAPAAVREALEDREGQLPRNALQLLRPLPSGRAGRSSSPERTERPLPRKIRKIFFPERPERDLFHPEDQKGQLPPERLKEIPSPRKGGGEEGGTGALFSAAAAPVALEREDQQTWQAGQTWTFPRGKQCLHGRFRANCLLGATPKTRNRRKAPELEEGKGRERRTLKAAAPAPSLCHGKRFFGEMDALRLKARETPPGGLQGQGHKKSARTERILEYAPAVLPGPK